MRPGAATLVLVVPSLALSVLFFTPAALGAGAPISGLPIDPGFAGDAVWDDGLAEVSTYASERVIYGKARPHELTMILVKEEFADALHVKADPPYEGRSSTTVLKLNLAATIPTDNYPYQLLTSVFVDRRDPRRLIKASSGSQEWCGNIFKEITTWGGEARLHFHSYFDGQGDGERALPLRPDALLDEQLLVVVRALSLEAGARVPVRVADPITSGNPLKLEVRSGELSMGVEEDVVVPAGRFRARRVVVRVDGGRETTYWVDVAATRGLVRVESSDGGRISLISRVRRDYWSRRAISDR